MKGDRKHGTRIGQEKNAFKNRWGRERFPGEPGSPDNPWEGFLVQVFKPTPEDNGKVAIGGFMYDPQKFEYNGMISTNFFEDHNKETLRLFSLFPRDVVATMDQNEKILNVKQLLTIAAYFRRFDIPIEAQVIDGFVRKLQHTRGVDFYIIADKQKKTTPYHERHELRRYTKIQILCFGREKRQYRIQQICWGTYSEGLSGTFYRGDKRFSCPL